MRSTPIAWDAHPDAVPHRGWRACGRDDEISGHDTDVTSRALPARTSGRGWHRAGTGRVAWCNLKSELRYRIRSTLSRNALMALWIALTVVFVGLFVVFVASRTSGSNRRSGSNDRHTGSDSSSWNDRNDDCDNNDSGGSDSCDAGGDSGGGGDGGGGGGD